MKLSIKNKKIVIVCIVILIVAVICGIYFYSRNSYTTNDSLKDNAYIKISSLAKCDNFNGYIY